MNSTTTLTTPAPVRRTPELDQVIANRVVGLRRAIRRFNVWHAYAVNPSLGGRVPSMPSKRAKHQAYDDARAIQHYLMLGLLVPDEIRGTRDEWQWTVDQAVAAGITTEVIA